MHTRIKIGVSACLLGDAVRYDGGHERSDIISEALGQRFLLIPICPEMAVHMGVPRAPIQLVGDPFAPRALGVTDRGRDVTAKLVAHGREVRETNGDISGFIFKSSSPSCGLRRVKVFTEGGELAGRGTGIFTRSLLDTMPGLPVVEEGELADEAMLERFIQRVCHYETSQMP